MREWLPAAAIAALLVVIYVIAALARRRRIEQVLTRDARPADQRGAEPQYRTARRADRDTPPVD